MNALPGDWATMPDPIVPIFIFMIFTEVSIRMPIDFTTIEKASYNQNSLFLLNGKSKPAG
jgi:hypothetical protein